MSRKPRKEYPGGIYHVMQRGNNREYIFSKDEEKRILLELFTTSIKRFGCEIYAYVIMDNHYHILLKTNEVPLNKIMHWINNKYSRNYNINNKRTGPNFDNRYKSVLVEDNNYLLVLLRYIHQNPVKAGIVNEPEEYKWSSDNNYRENDNFNFINNNFISKILSKNQKDAVRLYKDFISEKEEIEETIDKGQLIIENIEEDRKSLDAILLSVVKDMEIFNDIKRNSRKRNLSNIKKEFVENSLTENYSINEIAKSINITESAIYKILGSK